MINFLKSSDPKKITALLWF